MWKKTNNENYLERKPIRTSSIRWTKNDEDIVTLEIENKGIFNKLAQLILKKPPITYIHLDEMGSFIWIILDGEKSIIDLGEVVKKRFGEKAEPLYPRLAKHIQILESYNFIAWSKE